MITRTDIQKLQDLPIEQVAEALGFSLVRHTALCPFHDDRHPSLTFSRSRNRYRCYVCDARGGVIDLVMHQLQLGFHDACHWLARTYGIPLNDTCRRPFPDIKPRKVQPVRSNDETASSEKPDLPYLERLMAQPILDAMASHFLFDERKLAHDVVSRLGLSSVTYDCPMSSRPQPSYFDGPSLLIPYRDLDGKLVSVQSRYLGHDDRPRFRFPKGSSCHIFNLNALPGLASETPLFITEGVTDCLAMLSAGFASIAIPSATQLKANDVETLRAVITDRSLSLHMHPDADAPGERLFQQLQALLPQLVRHRLPQGFKDIGAYYAFIHKDDPTR